MTIIVGITDSGGSEINDFKAIHSNGEKQILRGSEVWFLTGQVDPSVGTYPDAKRYKLFDPTSDGSTFAVVGTGMSITAIGDILWILDNNGTGLQAINEDTTSAVSPQGVSSSTDIVYDDEFLYTHAATASTRRDPITGTPVAGSISWDGAVDAVTWDSANDRYYGADTITSLGSQLVSKSGAFLSKFNSPLGTVTSIRSATYDQGLLFVNGNEGFTNIDISKGAERIGQETGFTMSRGGTAHKSFARTTNYFWVLYSNTVYRHPYIEVVGHPVPLSSGGVHVYVRVK